MVADRHCTIVLAFLSVSGIVDIVMGHLPPSRNLVTPARRRSTPESVGRCPYPNVPTGRYIVALAARLHSRELARLDDSGVTKKLGDNVRNGIAAAEYGSSGLLPSSVTDL